MIKISERLSLPLDVATKRLAFLGTTGSGKSYAAMKLAEEMLASGIQVVVIDIVGVWYGLRVSGNGKGPGIQIPVFGGQHGDVPIEPTAGAIIADLVADRRISAVIDLSQMDSDTDALRFARDFGKQIFVRYKQKPSAVMIFLEECQELIPENPGSQYEIQCLHSWKRVDKIGRNFGLGMSLISQRPQEINKKCLNLSECVFGFQMIGSHEREAMKKWIHSAGGDENILRVLPTLEIGHPYVYSPRWLKVSGVYPISKRWTFDASSTPEVGVAREAVVRPLSADELRQLSAKMAETIEKAKAEDPKLLRQKIAELQKELSKKAVQPEPAKANPEARKKSVDAAFSRGFEAGKKAYRQEIAPKIKDFVNNATNDFGEAVGVQVARLQNASAALKKELQDSAAKLEVIHPVAPVAPVASATVAKNQDLGYIQAIKSNGASSVGRMARKILTVLAQYPVGMNLDRLAILAGSTVNGHFNNTLGTLRTVGFVSPARVVPIQITQEGIDALGHYDPLPVGAELREYWIRRLGNGMGSKILRALIAQYPETISLDELAAVCESSVNGHFNNSIGSLRTMGLMTPARTPIKASDYLFGE